LYKEASIRLSKGLYVRAPYLPNLDEVDFVKKQDFFMGYLGGKRPLIGSEVAILHGNIQIKAFGTAILIGFSQVAQSKDVTSFLLRCIEVGKKYIALFSEKLKESDLPVPLTWDADITKSTAYTFSDQLMMYYATDFFAFSIGVPSGKCGFTTIRKFQY